MRDTKKVQMRDNEMQDKSKIFHPVLSRIKD
jgi:hypothetical protein